MSPIIQKMTYLIQIKNKILDFLFPMHCISCNQKDTHLCFRCASQIPLAENDPESGIISIFNYKNPIIKKALWMLKYGNKKDMAVNLAAVAHDVLLEELADLAVAKNFTHPLLIPIPLSEKRIKERGYNQSELLAEALIQKDGSHSFALANDVLYKIKDTKNQAEIKDRKDRMTNLKDCFAVKNEIEIKNRNIILIDDVTTTGATLKEARKVLKRAGAKKILSLTIAH